MNPATEYDIIESRRLKHRPKCDECKEPISGYFFKVDGDRLCEECHNKKYRYDLEDYEEA